MKKISYYWVFSFLLGGLLFLLSGCASSKPSKFYALNTMKISQDVRRTAFSDKHISIGLGPVEIPDYLDRPQIVTRTGQNELLIAEFERWTGSLREDIERVLLENLSILVSQETISVVSTKGGMPFHYRLAVNVIRFDVMPEGDVELKAQWVVAGKEMQQILMRESDIREQIKGKDYSERVSAMSRALEKLSRDIGEGIKSVSVSR
ncbi:MAG: PqiC family protein [Nitrospiraceae bacterium]|nr:PqiC family protein [Nitrospiraceae bacterium]